MDGNKRRLFKKPQTHQFKRKGVSRKERWNNSSREESSRNSLPVDTVYRILCPSRKIGGVIGKGGSIVKALREETQAKITVADPVHGSDERVIIIYSSPEKNSRRQNNEEDSTMKIEQEAMELHCAAQDALLKVHERIVEEDLFGGTTSGDDNETNVVTARLLVPNNMVGCLLGRRGDVIQRLRSETGASIRVLPADHLPVCALSTDELVQISAKPDVAKRALYEVSTLLHQNPRKDKPPIMPMPYGGQSFHAPGGPMKTMHPPETPAWSNQNSSSHNLPPMQWIGEYDRQPTGLRPGGFDGVPPGHGREPSAEFSMKIVCSAEKIGGVIGKGGSNVKLVQQETGASIHVEDALAEADERVIRISAFEGLWNPRSQTIDAILQLQNKTSEFSDKGTISTRLLVPSSKVGCILGQGGQVINEMRRRTQADIRVYSKDDKPRIASEDEELVQITGNFVVAKDALSEIASRLRVRTLRDANSGMENGPVEPVQRFGSRGLPGRGPLPSGLMGAGSSGRYESTRDGRHNYEPQTYPVPPPTIGSRYTNVNGTLEANISNNGVNPVLVAGGVSNYNEVVGARVKLQDPQSGRSENVVEYRRSSEHLNAAQGFLQTFAPSSGQNSDSQLGSYRKMTGQQSTYRNVTAAPGTYHSPYDNMNVQKNPYTITAQQGVYANAPPPQAAYHNTNVQPGTYQY